MRKVKRRRRVRASGQGIENFLWVRDFLLIFERRVAVSRHMMEILKIVLHIFQKTIFSEKNVIENAKFRSNFNCKFF